MTASKQMVMVTGALVSVGHAASCRRAVCAGDDVSLPHSYAATLALMMISMVAWDSWANAHKFDRTLRFEGRPFSSSSRSRARDCSPAV